MRGLCQSLYEFPLLSFLILEPISHHLMTIQTSGKVKMFWCSQVLASFSVHCIDHRLISNLKNQQVFSSKALWNLPVQMSAKFTLSLLGSVLRMYLSYTVKSKLYRGSTLTYFSRMNWSKGFFLQLTGPNFSQITWDLDADWLSPKANLLHFLTLLAQLSV